MNEETLLHEALARGTPAERAAFLDEACAGRPELMAAVEARLAARIGPPGRPIPGTATQPAETGEFVPAGRGSASATSTAHPSAPDSTPDPAAIAAGIGTEIAGRYKLEQRIGEGGMGEVWVARQTEPVRRTVALKLIKPGMDSRAVLQRFEQERQALALMDHPNIARVLDAGLTPAGRPFFAMELVDGTPLTRFCDEARLTLRRRLELFVPICRAVQHAHQKGVIHRDLKPSNILVTMIDGHPVPKVIDFGVAKATGAKLTDESLSTQLGAVVGTLEYMAPEQAGYSGEDVDTRADVYSLGVVLYELLTGLRPIDAGRLKKAALSEMLRIIQEEEPSRPSTRLSGERSLPSLAGLRQTEPRRLKALLRGELDWIVMRCLEKRRDRRYETAIGLARDVERYLADEPVEARPPSASYRLGKLLRRNRGPVAAASLVLLTLIAGVIGTTRGMLAAQDARRAETKKAESEKRQRSRAEAAELEAREQAEEAREQLERARAVTEFLERDLLGQAGSWNQAAGDRAPDPDLKVSDALDRAAEAVGAKFRDRPDLEASIRRTIGEAYRQLGAYERGVEQLRRAAELGRSALGEEHPTTLNTLNDLALALNEAGRGDEAIALFKRARDAQTRLLGPEHAETLSTLNNLAVAYRQTGRAADAVAILVRVLEARSRALGPEAPDTLSTMSNLATAYLDVGRPDESIALLERVGAAISRRLGPAHPDTLTALNNLAELYRVTGQTDRAIELHERIRDASIEALGPEHPHTLGTLATLAGAYHLRGRTEEARAILERVRDAQLEKLGADHPETLVTLNELGMLYLDVGRADEAVGLLERVAEAFERTRGPDHPDTLTVRTSLAGARARAGRVEEGLSQREQVVEASTKALGRDHPRTLAALNNLAATYWQLKQPDKSVPLFEEVVAAFRKVKGADHPETLAAAANLGVNYRDAGRAAEAIPLLEEAARGRFERPELEWVAGELMETYIQQNRRAEGVAFVGEEVARVREARASGGPELAGALAVLGLWSVRLEAWEEAEPLIREALAIREAQEPDDWRTFNTKSLLGGALLGQGKLDEAGPLLLEGYEGMRAREEKIPPSGRPRLDEALDRLIALSEARGQQEEAAKWRAEREARERLAGEDEP